MISEIACASGVLLCRSDGRGEEIGPGALIVRQYTRSARGMCAIGLSAVEVERVVRQGGRRAVGAAKTSADLRKLAQNYLSYPVHSTESPCQTAADNHGASPQTIINGIERTRIR
jgi:hypothetical protein